MKHGFWFPYVYFGISAVLFLSVNSFAFGELSGVDPDAGMIDFVDSSDGPNPNEVYIESISYGGTGCPQGTVGQSLSDDRKSFTLIFDQFIATSGQGVPVSESRKDCQLSVKLRYPQGWSYSIAQVDYRGYVQLPAGLKGSIKSHFRFPGMIRRANSKTSFMGPVAKDYLHSVQVPMSVVSWSACGSSLPLNIDNRIKIDPPDSGMSGQITVDSIDGKVSHVFALIWKKC